MNQNDLKELFSYNPETGEFIRLKSVAKRAKVGDKAGSINRDGYIYITINYKKFLIHRLAWLYVYGEFPENEIDHINGNPSDNRIGNLRSATRCENMNNVGKHTNNTSGYKGVSWSKEVKKWEAKIAVNKKRINLGYFDKLESAYNAYCQAAKNLHGEFANIGISQ